MAPGKKYDALFSGSLFSCYTNEFQAFNQRVVSLSPLAFQGFFLRKSPYNFFFASNTFFEESFFRERESFDKNRKTISVAPSHHKNKEEFSLQKRLKLN